MQVGSPRTLYENPDNLFVAHFIGSPKINIMACSVDKTSYSIPGHGSEKHGLQGDVSTINQPGVRPEHMKLGGQEGSASHCWLLLKTRHSNWNATLLG